jgi:hypothetical protein
VISGFNLGGESLPHMFDLGTHHILLRRSWKFTRAIGARMKLTSSMFSLLLERWRSCGELALVASGCDGAMVSSNLAEWLEDRGIAHIRGALCRPQT